MEARQQNKKSRRLASSGRGNAMAPRNCAPSHQTKPRVQSELGATGCVERAQMRSASRQTIPHKSRDLHPSFIRTIPSAPESHRILLCQTPTRLAGFTADRELSLMSLRGAIATKQSPNFHEVATLSLAMTRATHPAPKVYSIDYNISRLNVFVNHKLSRTLFCDILIVKKSTEIRIQWRI